MALPHGLVRRYFEKILKGTTTSLWMRNVQLGLISVVVGLCGVVWKDDQALASGGFFQGYSPLVWTVVLLQSLGGLVVACVIKYADNVVKSFANSISAVLISIVSYAVMGDGEPLETNFVVGACIVVGSAFLYGTSK